MTIANGTHRTRMKVRGYELDSYRHVNHAVYLNYLEQARWEFLAEHGLTLSKLNEMKRWPVVVHLEIDYRKPAFIDDVLEISTKISRIGNSSFDIDHQICKQDFSIVEAKVTAAITDELGRPTRVPQEFHKLIGAT